MNLIWPLHYFLIFALVLFTLVLAFLVLARKYQLMDAPNERSSHSLHTIRGGGVVFLFAIISYLIVAQGNYFVPLCGALFLGLISFVDDVKSLPAKLRLSLHFMVVVLLLFELNLLHFTWLLPVMLIIILWVMNAYNFMDGINGITFLNTLAHLSALGYASYHTGFIDINLLLVLLIANLVFGFFNFRKRAICFLGDVGSIPLGFVLISITLLLMISTESIDPMVFFCVYMIDSGWTILQRFIRRENILKPHRKHLYQILVNEHGMGHLTVSCIYFLIQLVINIGYFLLDNKIGDHWYFLLTVSVLSLIYLPLKFSIVKQSS